MPSAGIRDLDLRFFLDDYLPRAVSPDVLAENRRSEADQLRSLRFLSADGEPTVVGVLVLGRDPRLFVPGFYVQFVRFEGTRLTDPIHDQKEVAGPLASIIRRLDEILEAHNEVAVDLRSGTVESRSPEYPAVALQQLTRNAILHRSYEGTNAPVLVYWFQDRIEIHNPGGPFGRVTRENFGRPGINDYRNPHLAEAMKVLGFVQRFGVGIQIAKDAFAQNGNPPLEFTVEENRVLAQAFRRA